ncbi:MAG: flagellar protein FlaG [Ghiorsea sp.]
MVAISSVTPSASTVALPTSGSNHVKVKAASVQVKPQTSTTNHAQPKEQPVTEQQVKQVVSEANTALAGSNESVAFHYEKKLGLLYVQVTDNQSGEVIREIPSKDFIQHRLAMREMVGLILDKEA